MRTITIDRKAWHYRLLRVYDFGYQGDFCGYTRAVMGALLLTVAISTLVVLFTMSAAEFLAWVAVMLIYWTGIEPNPLVMVAAITLGIGTLIGLFFGVTHLWVGATSLTKSAYDALPEERKVTLADWWGAIRDRICFRVDYL